MRNLTEKERSLISLCLGIGRDRFKGYSETIAHSGAAKTFAEQSEQCADLANLFSAADSVAVKAAES